VRSQNRAQRIPGWCAFLALISITVLLRGVHLLRIAHSPIFDYHHFFPPSDMYLFDQWSQRIAGGDVLGRESYQPVVEWQLGLAPLRHWQQWYGHPLIFYKAPFYAYLVALLYRLFGEPMLPLAILQIGVAAVSAVLLVRIGAELVGPGAGWLGAILFALYGPAIHYDVLMLRGPWIVLVSLLATWQLIGLQSKPSPLRAGVLGLTLGVALVVNEGFSLLPPLALVLLACWVRRIKRVALLSGCVLVGMVIALSPVIVRNVLVGAPPLALAVTGSCVFAVFNASDSSPYFFYLPASLPRLLEASGGKLVPTLQACLASFSGPASWFLFYLRKAAGTVIPYENPDNVNYYYAALKSPILQVLPAYGLLLPLAAVGLVLALRRPTRLAPLVPATGALFVSIMLTQPLSRYRATLAVYLMPFAGAAIFQGWHWLSQRRAGPLVIALLLAAAIGAGAAAFQQRIVFGGQPADLFLYRPTEFVLGVNWYAREGRRLDALHEILAWLQHNPDTQLRRQVLPMVVALRIDKRNPAELRAFLGQAAVARGNDAEFLMGLGDLSRQRLRDGAQARAMYESALALHPSGSTRRALRRRLGNVLRHTADRPPPGGG